MSRNGVMEATAEETDTGSTAVVVSGAADSPHAGGSRELLTLALPLVVSQSFMTVQVFVDTILLAWHDPREMAASFPAVMWFWLVFGLLQVTAGYVSTFVAQYTGAGRPERVGPAVWQGIHFAILAGLLFLLMVPAAPYSDRGRRPHDGPSIARGCVSAMPLLRGAADAGHGRGQRLLFWSRPDLDCARDRGGGHGGQRYAGLGVDLRPGRLSRAGNRGGRLGDRDRLVDFGARGRRSADSGRLTATQFRTLSGWRLERELFGRLMKYGGPAGAQVFLDVLVFNVFVQLVGRLGEAATGATTLAVRMNMVAFLPMMGIGQAVSILVGQRLGADRPDLAERSAYTGLKWVFGYMCGIAAVYLLIPGCSSSVFQGEHDPETFAAVAKIVPTLLACVAVYSLADAVNVTFSFALRGAGDTRFVSLLTFALAWPIMVVPTFVVVRQAAASTPRGYLRRLTSSRWRSVSSCGSAPANGKACG